MLYLLFPFRCVKEALVIPHWGDVMNEGFEAPEERKHGN